MTKEYIKNIRSAKKHEIHFHFRKINLNNCNLYNSTCMDRENRVPLTFRTM
jgi:hypothetical protein